MNPMRRPNSRPAITVVSGRLQVPPSQFLLEIPALLAEEYHFSLHALRVQMETASPRGVDVQSASRKNVASLALDLIRKRPTLIHQHWATWSTAAVLASVITRAPLVVSVHGYDAFLPPSAGPLGPMIDVVKRAERRRALRRASAIVVNSRFMRSRLEALRVPAEKIHVIRHGVEAKTFNPSMSSRRGLLFVGRLSPEKGISLLIDAISANAILARRELTVIGDGPQRLELEQECSKKGLSVSFRGQLPRDQVEAEMSKSELVVVPSIPTTYQQEASGLVPLEAMACGTPVIVTDVGGLPENMPAEMRHLVCSPHAASLAETILFALDSNDESLPHRLRAHVLRKFGVSRLRHETDLLYRSVAGLAPRDVFLNPAESAGGE